MDYSYIVESLKAKALADRNKYKIELSSITTEHLREKPLNKKHFSRKKSFLSIIKGNRRKKWKFPNFIKKRRPAATAALNYALSRRNELTCGKKLTFVQNQKLLSDLCKQCEDLQDHNKVEVPAYTSIL